MLFWMQRRELEVILAHRITQFYFIFNFPCLIMRIQQIKVKQNHVQQLNHLQEQNENNQLDFQSYLLHLLGQLY